MNSFLRTLLFVSAFAPVGFSLAFVRYSIEGWGTSVIQMLTIGALGTCLPYLILIWLAQRGEVIPFKAKKVEDAGFMLFAFVFSYFFPILMKAAGIDFQTAIWGIGIAGVILWLIPSIPAHPILRLFSIKFYKVESESGMVYTLISKEEIRSPSDIKRVHLISSAMLLKAS
ncbi:MAG: hypothetical protein EON54_09605 [Alcaligenaceae bacterium]|nr:MAG: hypothetical protein EON54_09605 [Alcaligenaceae bacterium]